MDIESLICGFQGINLEKLEKNDNHSRFLLNNKIITEGMKFNFVTDVKLDFYQLWSMFNIVPIVNKNGKTKYEWRFTTTEQSDVIFILCNVPNKESNLNFINTKYWRILCNKKDDVIIGYFLKTLCDALECYNTYYKESIESHTFISEDPLINSCLQKIKNSIIKNRDILKTI